MIVSETHLRIIREEPIEGIVAEAARNVYKQLSEEPSRESLLTLRSLVATAEAALKSIVEVDSKVRPLHEWLAALEEVEGIRDYAQDMIDILVQLL